jgi:diguanylate cyclase (GGDEF)-like protein
VTRSVYPFDGGALLDAIPNATAVLATDGTILAVNRAWLTFAAANGGTPERTGPGMNYLDVCRRAAASGCLDATEVEAGLRTVFAGGAVEYTMEYECSSHAVERWFVLRITQIIGEPAGALVSHTNVSRRKIAERNLERRASEDSLTELPNRFLFAERVTAALKAPQSRRKAAADVGLLFIDLDDFKPINDIYGHAAGDEVLQAVAARMRAVTRPHDTIARLGGDEFAVLSPRITATNLAALARRITEALSEPHLIHGVLVRIGASVGLYLATRGENVIDALGRADQAMYAMKRLRGIGSPPL